MRIALVVIGFLCLEFAKGQGTDSTQVLSLSEVLDLAIENHPIIRQANLQEGFAEAELRKARGNFDPKLSSQYATKQFKGTEYYETFYNALKIPVWFPIDPKLEIYRNEGQYLGDQDYVSSSTNYWQMTAGVSIPLGKGLFIDERRAMVKQAQYFGDLASAEQIKLTNKTLLTIVKSYWDWYLAFQQYELTRQSLGIAETLFQRVKMDYQFGEAAMVDTVQAKITYQSRVVDFQTAQLGLVNARLNLEIHLWGPNDIPLELEENVVPTDEQAVWMIPSDSSINQLVAWASKNHPEIKKIEAKSNQIQVERQWNMESLKPEINLSYSLIDAPMNVDGFQSPQWEDNYKLGLDFTFPLFLRKERGQLQKSKLYIEQLGFEQLQMQQSIAASVKSTFASLKTNERLANEYEEIANNYQLLLEAELFNLENGESDLFKINIQQDKYLESQMKYLKSFVKLQQLKAALPYETGLPNLSYQKLYE